MGNEWSKAEGPEGDETDKVRPKVRANVTEMADVTETYCYHIVLPKINALIFCNVSDDEGLKYVE
jgi:hypothetical protein